SNSNYIDFRFVFQNLSYTRTLARVNPVHNFLDDVSWAKGHHTIQFRANVRLIRNNRVSYSGAYDRAQTNPSGYQQGGNVVSDAVSAYLAANNLPALVSVSETQNAATALIGRYSQYTANFTFDHGGNHLPSGTPTDRNFATAESDLHIKHACKLDP